MRRPSRNTWKSWVMFMGYRILAWGFALIVVACAIGVFFGLHDAGMLVRLGALVIAAFFGYVVFKFEMLLREARQSAKQAEPAPPDSDPPPDAE